MRYEVKLQDGQRLIVDKAFWTGKTELRLDNVIVGKMGMTRKSDFKIKFKNSTEHGKMAG